MEVSAGVKTGLYGISAILLWITSNLGVAFYVLVGAYVIDFALHYHQKQEFIQRMTFYLGSTFFSFYLQNGPMFVNVPLLHGLIVMLAAHESLEVVTELKAKLDIVKANNPGLAGPINNLENVLDDVQEILPGVMDKAPVAAGSDEP